MIKYNGKKLSDFGLHVNDNFDLTSPEADLEFFEIKGRDGEVVISNDRLKTVNRAIPFSFVAPKDMTVEKMSTSLVSFLRKEIGFLDFEIETDPDYIYKAMNYQEYDVQRIISLLGKVTLSFKFHPVKYLKTGLIEKTFISGEKITNPTSRKAKPLIKLKGSGNIEIKIGKSSFNIKGLDANEGIIIDSEKMTVTTYDGTRNLFSKVTSMPFPYIEPGNQTITIIGNTTERKITPRWEEAI